MARNKYIQVESGYLREVRRLGELERKERDQSVRNLEHARQSFQNVSKEIERHSKPDVNELRRAVKEEEHNVGRQLDNLSDSLRKEIQYQNENLRKELDNIRRNVDSTNHEIDHVNARIAEVSEQFEAGIQSIAERISKQEDRAQVYAVQLQELLDAIGELHPEQLAPERIAQIRETNGFVQADIKNGDYQAAIGLAQDNIAVAVILQAELERWNDEYDDLRESIERTIVNVEERIGSLMDFGANARVMHITVGSDTFEFRYDGDIDHWTNGLFYQLCDAFYELEDRVCNEYIENMDLENMRIADRDFPEYNSRLDRCAAFAEEEFAISCRVQGTAIRINRALTEDGTWQLTGSGFEQGDNRQSYYVAYSDGQGNRSTIVILPNKEDGNKTENCEAQFSVGTCDGEYVGDTALCAILREAVLARLRQNGIDTGSRNSGRNYRQSMDAGSFMESIYREGNGIKAERIRKVQNQINL